MCFLDERISFHCNGFDILPPKPKFTFNKCIQEIHMSFVLAPAYKYANNVVVV